MADYGQKTEQPTERRIEKARREGNFPVSREFVASVQFAVFVTMLVGLSGLWLFRARSLTRFLLARGFEAEVDTKEVSRLFYDVFLPAMTPLAAAGAALVIVTLGVQVATTRVGISLRKLSPDLQRLNPFSRIRNLPRQNVPQFLYAAVLLPLFVSIVYLLARAHWPLLLRMPLLDVESGLARMAASVRELLWKAAVLLLVLGAIDLTRKRRRYRKDLRMSKQEIRDELKEVEGNPQIKARIRRLQRDLLRRQMMKEVPLATAVVVNPTHYAVALRYRFETMNAPKVVAKGKNYLARRIRQIAVDHEVPIVENPPLAQALYKSADVGQEIPPHLYRAVAEILAYIYRLMKGRWPGVDPGGRKGA